MTWRQERGCVMPGRKLKSCPCQSQVMNQPFSPGEQASAEFPSLTKSEPARSPRHVRAHACGMSWNRQLPFPSPSPCIPPDLPEQVVSFSIQQISLSPALVWSTSQTWYRSTGTGRRAAHVCILAAQTCPFHPPAVQQVGLRHKQDLEDLESLPRTAQRMGSLSSRSGSIKAGKGLARNEGSKLYRPSRVRIQASSSRL